MLLRCGLYSDRCIPLLGVIIMTTFTITDLAGHGLDMSAVSAAGTIRVTEPAITPVLISDNGYTAFYYYNAGPISYFSLDYYINNIQNTFFIYNLYYYT